MSYLLHTPSTSKLFISTVSYSVKVYGPDTEPENILRMAVRIDGEGGTQTEFKYLTNKATEGYEMYRVFIRTGGALVGEGGRGRETSRVIIAPVCG